MRDAKAQTATEYLIILAVVIVIALIVVAVLGGIPSIGGGATRRTVLLSTRTLPVGITDFKYMGGGVAIKIINNQIDIITIQNITLDQNLLSCNDISYPFQLQPGESSIIKALTLYVDGTSDIEICYSKLSGEKYCQKALVKDKVLLLDIKEGLVAHLTFDLVNSTGHPLDSMHGLLSGELLGNASLSSSKFGRGLVLDGNDGALETAFSTTNIDAVSFWVKIEDANSSQTILQANNGDWVLSYSSSQRFKLLYDDGGETSSTFYYSPFKPNIWHHVVLNDCDLYVDGSIINSSFVLPDFENLNLAADYHPGWDWLPGSTSYNYALNGSIDEIMIWDRILSSEEINALYNLGR